MQNKNTPKWFKGMIYTNGARVENPFSKEEYELDGLELSIYDFIIGSQLVMETAPRSVTPAQIKDFNKALDWFRKNNPEAYMALLD